jgi:hypothetical protein
MVTIEAIRALEAAPALAMCSIVADGPIIGTSGMRSFEKWAHAASISPTPMHTRPPKMKPTRTIGMTKPPMMNATPMAMQPRAEMRL